MPHQCLTCGESFADGSTDLLKGCPQCEGTRFFYTDEPLDDSERAELKEQTDKNVHEMLHELVESGEKRDLGEDIWSRDAWERWIRLERSEEGGKPVSAYLDEQDRAGDAPAPPDGSAGEEQAPVKPTLQVKLDDVEEVAPPEEPPEAEPREEPQEAARPSTLNILEPGNYEIDVERLMEDSPVIVERDGSYVIHLPSVFEKGKRR